ncbi:hypothetical protein ACJIZ3_018334 [Penstemon smallii]|uniref:TPX2 C-terminal domain-containing protein n=1 Tax=Penstemon smallii TaxID=265156 RepID=A0ABD3SY13_9LAMI
MADSACLMQGFSLPNQYKQENPVHVLGESVSFGRFTTESLSWEKWSTFSHKKYVEEAERYAQPGSVAQKKAFFEAHYKKIAAQKAAALLEQENEPKTETENNYDNNNTDDQQRVVLSSPLNIESKIEEVEIANEDENAVIIVENQGRVSVSEGSGTPQMERPLLKSTVCNEENPSVTSKKRSSLSSLKSSIQRKTWRVPSTPAKQVTTQFKKQNNESTTRKSNVDSMDKKSLRSLINSISTKEITYAAKKPKDYATPLRTPQMAAAKGVAKYTGATPLTEKRMKTPIDPSVCGSKTTGPKWHMLSSACSKSLTACRNKLQSESPATLSTPFILRTEERAAKRKQKLEDKFNANEGQKMQLQRTLKEKAGNEFRKLSRSFCFKARPLPDFYKERETTKVQTKKTPAAQPQTAVLGRTISNKKQVTVLTPPPPPPPKALTKNGASKTLSKNNVSKPSKSFTTKLPERIRHENRSPNIQQ